MKTRLLFYLAVFILALGIKNAAASSGTIDNRLLPSNAGPSNNAQLKSISLSPVSTLVGVAGPGYLNFTSAVFNNETSVQVIATAKDANATITVNGIATASGSASSPIALNVGANTITVVITAQDGVTQKTVIITVNRDASANASLSNLAISSGALTPAFATATINYTQSVPYTTSSVTVTPTTSDPTATVKVNGVTVASGTASSAIALAVGLNTITTVVTAQNGTNTKTYKISVTRAAPSNNALLTSISLSPVSTLVGVSGPGYLNFTSAVFNSETSVQVIATVKDANATITVNGVATVSGSASSPIALNVGANTITVVITAQDGVTQKTVIITVNRAASANANLSNLTLSSGALTPAFATATTSYTANVANATLSVTVTPTTSDPTATVKVNGITVASGSASSPIALAVGANTITTIVTAQNGTTKTYTITVTRSAVVITTFTWTGSGANPNWSNNNNWSPSSGHPIAGDLAIIGATANMPTIDVPSACSTLSITGATTITLAATLTVSGSADLNATLTISGGAGSLTTNSLTLNAGGGLTNSGAFTVNNGNISLAASTNINNLSGGTFNAASSPVINMLNSATITNGGIFNISGANVKLGSSGFITNATGGTFTINGGSSIDFAANTATSGYLLNNGTFYAGTSNSACTINLNYAGVNLQNSSTFYLGSTSVLNLTGAGTSVQNTGTFTLQSDVNGCAAIGNISGAAAVCTGIYNVERYITGGSSLYRGYRLLSSPVYTSTVAGHNVYSLNYVKLSSYITGTTGTTGGFDNTGSGNPTLYLFRENIVPSNASFTSGNYRGINDITQAPMYTMDVDGSGFYIPVGDGFLFFFRGDRSLATFTTETTATYVPTSTTLTATGTLNQGQITATDWYTPASSNLGYTTISGTSSVEGFNLVGNPYASSIDWDTYNSSSTSTGIYANNMSPFIYILDPVSKNYNIYATGTGGGGTIARTNSNIIPSGQGFFVIASDASAQLIFNESAKINSQANAANGNLFLGAKPLAVVNQYLHLKLAQDANNIDGLLLNFNSTAKSEYNSSEDALYKTGNGPVSLSSMSADNVALAINAMPLPKLTPTTIGLNVSADADGVYQLNLDEVKSIPDLYDIWLMDNYKKDSLDIKHNPNYSFNIYKSDAGSFGSKRFSLVIRQNPALMVHLLNFTATKAQEGAEVVWKTENEQNYTNFTIERSTDNGATFNVLGGFASSAIGTYSLADKDPLATNQYRLKIQDLNGDISYSAAVTLIYGNSTNVSASNLSVYPNPASGVINLAINQKSNNNLSTNLPVLPNLNVTHGSISTQAAATTQSYSIKIINITGTVIKTSTSSQVAWQGNVSNLNPGTYIIQVTNNADNRLVGKSTFVKL